MHRRFLFTFGVVFLALSLLTLVVVAMTDPFNRFRSLDNARTDGPYLENYLANPVLWEMFRMQRISAAEFDGVRLAILGDSRGDQLSADLDNVLGIKILNLSIGGAELNESLSIFEKFRPAIPGDAKLLITTPYVRVANLPSFNRVNELANMTEPFRYLTNGFVIKRSYMTLLSRIPRELNESEEERTRALRRKVISKWRVLLDSPLDVERLMNQVLPVIKGREAVFYLPPVDTEIRDYCMERLSCRTGVESLIHNLKEHGRVFDFFTHPNLDGHDIEFNDPVHTKHPDRILRHIVADVFSTDHNGEAIAER